MVEEHYGQRTAGADRHHCVCPNRAEKLVRSCCFHVLHGLCEALDPGFQPCMTLWGPVRISSLLPPSVPSEDPSWPVLRHLPARGGRSAWARGTTRSSKCKRRPQRQTGTQQESQRQLLLQAHIFWCLLFFSFLAMSPLLLVFSCEGENFATKPLFVVPAVHAAGLLWLSCWPGHPPHLHVMCTALTKLDGCPKGRLFLHAPCSYRTPFSDTRGQRKDAGLSCPAWMF